MKKLVVLILALCMLCSVAFANELTWASVEEAASQIAGEFKTFDIFRSGSWSLCAAAGWQSCLPNMKLS